MLSNSGIQKMADIGLMPFFLLLLTSLIASLFISHLYLRFYGSKGTGSTLHRAFPLLGVAITAIFVSLQFSIPLSLGLLGALSIVRFRTPIKDPEEVGFILLVIASSLTCATFNLPFLLLILSVAILGMIVLKFDKKFFTKNANAGMLVIKLPSTLDSKSSLEIDKLVKAYTTNSRLDSVTEDLDANTTTYTFGAMSDENSFKLKDSLLEISKEIKTNIFYSVPLS